MKFYSIRAGASTKHPGQPEAEGEKFESNRCPGCGNNVSVSRSYDRLRVRGGSSWPDLLESPTMAPVVSDRAVRIWKEAGFTGFNAIPVKVIGQAKLPPAPSYFSLSFPSWNLRPDPAMTLVTRQSRGVITAPSPLKSFSGVCVACGSERDLDVFAIYMPTHIALDESTWGDGDLNTWGGYIFVNERVIQVSLENKFTNFSWVAASEAANVTVESLKSL